MAEAKKNYSNIEKINSLLGAEGIGSLLKEVQGTEKKVGDILRKLSDLENAAKARFAQSLPDVLREGYDDVFRCSEDEERLIKAADKLAALLKCKTELDSGNREFAPAMASVEAALKG